MATTKSRGCIVARKMTRDLLLGIPDKAHRLGLIESMYWKLYSTHQFRLETKHQMLKPLLALEIGQAARINFAEDGKPLGFQMLDVEGNPDGAYCCID